MKRHTLEANLYACTIKDVFSNPIVGHWMDSRLKPCIALNALNNHGMVGLIGRVRAAGGNAAMEFFFARLEKNVVHRRIWATREGLRIAVVTEIEGTDHGPRRQVPSDN